MDATRDYHTKWSESERERQIPYDIAYMWNLNCDKKEPIYQTESLIQKADWWLPGEGFLGEGRSRRLGLADVRFYV